MKSNIISKNELTEFLLYNDSNGGVRVETYLHNETLWLSQKQIANLFGVQRPVITKHLQNIFESGELDEKVVCSILELPTQHGAIAGKNQNVSVKYYNLDAILSVGYRVNSSKATQFRIWATNTLKEFIIKGFAMDDERLKNGRHFGKDYFKELLERVRSIRGSERRIYQQITDIFAECSIDYDKNSTITQTFFAGVQNKFHYAITGKTAAEIIYQNADKDKQSMGLQTWKNAPEGRILKSDAKIAKNYLQENETKDLEGAVSGYFDYIAVNHSAKEFVNGMAHTNGIESVWAVLKRGCNGTFHNISIKHLSRYVDEFVFRLTEGNCQIDTKDRMASLFKGIGNNRISYKELTGTGRLWQN